MSSHSSEIVCKEIHVSWGDPNHIVQALTSRTQIECREIREKYKELYGEDLLTHILHISSQRKESRISPETCAGLSMLMLNPHERDADAAKQALEQQTGVNYKALIEVFAGRKSSHFLLIIQAYHAKFRRLLDQDIISIEPSTPYQKILMALAASHKSHHADVSEHIAKCDAQRLYQTGAMNESVVLEMLSKRSIPQFKLTFSSYKRIYGHDYTKSLLKYESYGEFSDALKEVVRYISNPLKFYAKILYANLQGTSVNKGTLAWVMVNRAEVDIDKIQSVFNKKYEMKLRDAVTESTLSRDYKDFLLAFTKAKDNTP